MLHLRVIFQNAHRASLTPGSVSGQEEGSPELGEEPHLSTHPPTHPPRIPRACLHGGAVHVLDDARDTGKFPAAPECTIYPDHPATRAGELDPLYYKPLYILYGGRRRVTTHPTTKQQEGF